MRFFLCHGATSNLQHEIRAAARAVHDRIADVSIRADRLRIALLATWLLKTSLGRKALVDSKPRRNDMPIYVPFVPFFFSFGVVSLAVMISKELTTTGFRTSRSLAPAPMTVPTESGRSAVTR